MPGRKSKRPPRNDEAEADDDEFKKDYVEEDDEGEEEEVVDEEQEDEEEKEIVQQKHSSRSRKRQKRIQVMSQSGQTEVERRILRQNQRKLFTQMTDSSLDLGDKMADVNSDTLNKVREKNNGLWNEVRFTREAVLDGENIEFISSRAARQLDQLISVPRYDADRLASKLRSKCTTSTTSSSQTFDWKTFGIEVGSCFNSIPTYCSFLNGAINAEYTPKERKKPIRRTVSEDEEEEVEVGAVNQKSVSKDDNKLSAVEKQLKVLNKTLKARDEEQKFVVFNDLSLDKYGRIAEDLDESEVKQFRKKIKKSDATRPCAVQFVMNPQSFTQTVENIFGLSFMVKKGDAEVGVRSFEACKHADLGVNPGPWVRVKKFDGNSQEQPPARQAIVSFTMQDWRALRDAYNIEEGDIPHRGRKQNVATTAN